MSTEAIDKQKITEALFYGVIPAFEQLLSTMLKNSDLHAVFLPADRNQLKQALQKLDIGILFLSDIDSTEIHEILTLKEAFQKDTQVLLHSPKIDYKFIEEMQENFELYRILSNDQVNDKLVEILHAAKVFYLERRENKNLFIKYHQKNKKWKELTQRLSAIEQERIDYISVSKQEESKKKGAEKKLQRFITNLSYVSNMDEYIKSVFRECRKQTEILGLYVFVQHHTLGQVLYSLQRGQFIFQRVDEPVSKLEKLDTLELREFLANRLNRPLLAVNKRDLDFKERRSGFVVFETEAKSSLGESFNHFWQQVRQALAMVLDRLLLRLEMENIRSVWEKTFESLSAPMVILDTDGKIVKMNKAFLQIQSYDLVRFLIDSHKLKKPLLDWRTQQQNFHLIAYPISFEHSAIESTLYYFQDQKEMQESYTKMVQNEKMAALGLLAGNIAHELNNPFAGLKSMTQILLLEAEHKKYYPDLEEILTGVNRCLQTIENLQKYTDDDDQSRQVLDMSMVVEKTIPLLKSALRQFRVTTQYIATPSVFGNSHLLQQVVFNLLHNACQAMKDGGQLQIIAHETKECAILSIADDGQGISESDIGYIFDPFFTTKKIGDGTGLGLSICKKIIDSHAGHIEVKSQLGNGTTFTIFLPKYNGIKV
jgi:two-component system NtrC family sensor kinase